MKECGLKLVGFVCNNQAADSCILMDNEKVAGGKLTGIEQAFKEIPTERLRNIALAHSPGGQWAERCIASPQIVNAINLILSQREKNHA